MAQIYKHTKTGVKATLIEINEKTKNVTLQKADGKFTSTTLGPFEKYWRLISEDTTPVETPETEEQEEVVESEENVAPEEEAATEELEETTEEEPEEEEQPKKEKKAKAPKKPKFDAQSFFDRAKAVVEEAGFSTKTYHGMDRFLCVFDSPDKKNKVYEMNFTGAHFRVYTKQERVPEDIEFKAMKNALNAGITFEYDEAAFEDTIKTILSWELPEEEEQENEEEQ